ncbi:MAG: hypothetical protein EOP53_09995 [Sphingobacteriales bacterium]|nr:MAG: hypothetical protein EOP53_09995 [Sphingobacteriales bacterium]
MSSKKKLLFAIFRNGIHIGNERGNTMEEAIRNYIIASDLNEFINDKELISRYNAILAIKNTHYTEPNYLRVSKNS